MPGKELQDDFIYTEMNCAVDSSVTRQKGKS